MTCEMGRMLDEGSAGALDGLLSCNLSIRLRKLQVLEPALEEALLVVRERLKD